MTRKVHEKDKHQFNAAINRLDLSLCEFNFPVLIRRISFLLCFTLILSCSTQKLPVRELPVEREGQRIAAVKAEIASTAEERAQGLMHRKKLPDGEGMLFVFERDEVLSFWMKNTYIPLSIAFIASDGRIIEIKDMYPKDENSVVSSRSVRYALEVPQGWFSRAGIITGDVIGIK
ncbi:MAG: DUF192 domain-containing protein [Treponema sp.]|nr:DUF192 domain-containing protein [Treponema sp.]